MELKVFEAIVAAAGGPEYIIGLRFKNGYKVVFSKHVLNLTEDIVDMAGTNVLKYEHYGTNNEVVSISYLPLDEIGQVYTLTSLDTQNLRLREFME